MRRSFLIVAAVAAVLMTGSAVPAHADQSFIVVCGFAHRAPNDPIVYPKQPGASHMHDFFGNKSTNAFSTYRSMLTKGTSCPMRGETAAYWAPTLFRGSGMTNPITPRRITVYYRDRPQPDKRTYPFPRNFRMIAGRQPGVLSGWNCDGTTLHKTVLIDCSGGTPGHTYVRGTVIFPMCGELNASGHIVRDSPDHQSHVTYGTARSGCPKSHPVQLPAIKVNIRYDVSNCIAAKCHLASDMPGDQPGSTFHADYWNTWHQRLLKTFVNTKLN